MFPFDIDKVTVERRTVAHAWLLPWIVFTPDKFSVRREIGRFGSFPEAIQCADRYARRVRNLPHHR